MNIENTILSAFKELLECSSNNEKAEILKISQQAFFEVPEKFLDKSIKLTSGEPLKMRHVFCNNHWEISTGTLHGYLLALIWNELVTGSIQSFVIEANGSPERDKHREINQKKLEALPEPFKAQVWLDGHCLDDDGVLCWEPDVNFKFSDINRAPLEIGFCNLTTIWRHLIYEGSVCLYPYNVNYLILLLTKPRSLTDLFLLN